MPFIRYLCVLLMCFNNLCTRHNLSRASRVVNVGTWALQFVLAFFFWSMLSPFRSFQPPTGEPFFQKRLLKEANNLRMYIAKGCLSDPVAVPMYAHDSKTLHGLDKIPSLRGTGRVENLHKPLRSLLGGKTTGVRLAHSTLLVYNYRRNHRIAGTVNIIRAPTQALFN